jgi:hypothetical protein
MRAVGAGVNAGRIGELERVQAQRQQPDVRHTTPAALLRGGNGLSFTRSEQAPELHATHLRSIVPQLGSNMGIAGGRGMHAANDNYAVAA